MKMWSQGLGKIELEVDGREADVVKKGEELQIVGVTDAPVQWNFEITIEKEDFIGLLHLIFTRKMFAFLKANSKLLFTSLFDRSFEHKQLKEELPK